MNMEDNKNTEQRRIYFAAIGKSVQDYRPSSEEVEASGRDWIAWGKRNDFPNYIYCLSKAASTLKAVIDGCCDYVAGNKITCEKLPYENKYMNRKKQSPAYIVRALARDYFRYGGFCFEVIRSNSGEVVEVYYVDLRFIRANKESDVFWYSEDWTKRWGKKTDIQYPAFRADATGVDSSLFYWKNVEEQVYPECPFEGSIIAAELERDIDQYHLNSMNNNFAGSFLVNFNNGVPPEETRKEIERDFNAKYSGYQNGCRIVYSWNDSKDAMTILQEIKSSDFSEKYDALSKRSRQQIFTAFRANPNLFGIPTENLGFSSEEYESAFKLFNRTMIQPVQNSIIDALQAVFNFGMTITPFTLAGDVEGNKTGENAQTVEE